MIPYILLFLVVFLFSNRIRKEKWMLRDIILLGILILFSGLRYGIGVDYPLYETIYSSSYYSDVSIIASSRTGIGFSYLMILSNKIGLNFPAFIFLCSLVTIIGIYVFFKKYSIKPGLAILIYISLGFYTASFNGFRQQLGLSLALIGLMFFREKKYIYSIVLFVISFVVHSSLLISIIVYILIERKKIKIRPIVLYGIFLIAYIFYDHLFSSIIVNIDSYSGYLDYDSIPGVGTFLMVFLYIFVTIVFIFRNRKILSNINQYGSRYINYLLVGTAIMILQLKNWLFVRLVVDFTIFMPLLLAELYSVKINKERSLQLIFFTLLFIYYVLYINSFGGVVPYNSILSL